MIVAGVLTPSSCYSIASFPGPLVCGEGPDTRCMCMLYFPSKHWEFGFYRNILLRVEIVNCPFHTSLFCLCENSVTSVFTKSDCILSK